MSLRGLAVMGSGSDAFADVSAVCREPDRENVKNNVIPSCRDGSSGFTANMNPTIKNRFERADLPFIIRRRRQPPPRDRTSKWLWNSRPASGGDAAPPAYSLTSLHFYSLTERAHMPNPSSSSSNQNNSNAMLFWSFTRAETRPLPASNGSLVSAVSLNQPSRDKGLVFWPVRLVDQSSPPSAASGSGPV